MFFFPALILFFSSLIKPRITLAAEVLANHAKQIAGIDLFTVPTIHFRNLYCFVILLQDRREVVHFNVTEYPAAKWAAQQIIEAFPDDQVPRYLLRDRDGI
jgi:putative transposase